MKVRSIAPVIAVCCLVFMLNNILYAKPELNQGEVTMKKTYFEQKNIRYGNHKNQIFDISLPEKRDRTTPVTILIHGGGWAMGNKSELDFYRNALAKEGFAAASMNYRFVNGSDVALPEIMEDITGTIDYISNHAEEWSISPETFCLTGHSVGGHLGLLYAYAFNGSNKVKAAVGIAPPVDLTEPKFHDFTIRFLWKTLSSKKQIEMLTRFDASKEKEYSPAYTKGCSPTLLFFAKEDEFIPIIHAQIIENSLKYKRCPYKLYILDGSHFFINDPIAQKTMLPHIIRWIKKYCISGNSME